MIKKAKEYYTDKELLDIISNRLFETKKTLSKTQIKTLLEKIKNMPMKWLVEYGYLTFKKNKKL